MTASRWLLTGILVSTGLGAIPAHAGPARNERRALRTQQRAQDFSHVQMLEKLASHSAYHFTHEAPNAEHAVVSEEAKAVFTQQAERPGRNDAYRTAWALVEQMGPTEAMRLSRNLILTAKTRLQMNTVSAEHGATLPTLATNPQRPYETMLHEAIVNERLVDSISHAKKLTASERKRMAQHVVTETR